MVKHVLNKKYTTSVKVPEITEEDKYKALKFRVGDRLKAKFFVGHYHKPFIRECVFLGVSSGKCGFTTLRVFSPLIPRVYRFL